MEVAASLPSWFVYIAGGVFGLVFSGFCALLWHRHTKVEQKLESLSEKVAVSVSEESHKADIDLVNARLERTIDKIVERQDKEFEKVNRRIDESFIRVEEKIERTNGKLDDLLIVLLNYQDIDNGKPKSL